jgi:hypothetical protein
VQRAREGGRPRHRQLGAIVEHECVLAAANVHICAGAVLAGNVSVGPHTLVGLARGCCRDGASEPRRWWERGRWCLAMCPTGGPSWAW